LDPVGGQTQNRLGGWVTQVFGYRGGMMRKQDREADGREQSSITPTFAR
jgi:hypothetical protein